MYEFLRPSLTAFQSRKLFHSYQKEQGDTVEEWFRCIIDTLEGCEYGELSEFMLIDKFIAGLDDETCEKPVPYATIAIDTLQSIELDIKNHFAIPLESTTCDEITNDIEDFLAVDDIKVEEDEEGLSNESEDNLLDHYHETRVLERDFSGDDTKIPNYEFSRRSQKNTVNQEDIKSTELIQHKSSDERKPKVEIKGFKREKSKDIICLDCGKCFKQKNTYNYHKRWLTGKNLYNCNMCEKAFVKAVQLKRHKLTHDNDNKLFECYLWLSKFDRIHGLRIHFTILHTTKTKRNLRYNSTLRNTQEIDPLIWH
ncbi:zinc finger protein 431-like [Sitodiplosis mosellana]|uniref:zinc finger protein 431-like n=1 Tax=Sitodiplosis mosellana TaxID=263140 RepID=UPI002445088E|nr:zinc finger protein 431-like [Sitodiplosis mosellana]